MKSVHNGIRLIDDKTPFHVKEAYRLLRANIQFLSPHDGCKVICVSSSIAHEGKSSVSFNLSSLLSGENTKVLLLDADLRASYLQENLGLKGKQGLSDILAGKTGCKDYSSLIRKKEGYPYLDIIVSGKYPPNPSELLASDRMAELLEECKEHYDYIIIDGTPLCIVSDALVLSPHIDGFILVAMAETSSKRMIKNAVSMIRKINGKVLGFVLTKKRVSGREKNLYGGYNTYYNTGY